MENKKYLPIKIIHLILMVAAIILCFVSLMKTDTIAEFFSDPGLHIASYIAAIFALISGIIYLAFGYKKNAAVYYKAFMVILVVVQAIICYRQMTGAISPDAVQASFIAICNIVSFIMLVILATGKDLGKAKAYVVASILLVCRLSILILDLIVFRGMLRFVIAIISFAVSDVLLAGTAFFMVTGKYLDKDARGTK